MCHGKWGLWLYGESLSSHHISSTTETRFGHEKHVAWTNHPNNRNAIDKHSCPNRGFVGERRSIGTNLCGTTNLPCHTSWPSICTACALRVHCVGNACALRGQCVRTACILRTQRPGYSPKNTCHLTGCTAKQQSPHENDETAFNLVLHCPYEQTTQPCKVRLLRVFRCPWLRSWKRRCGVP